MQQFSVVLNQLIGMGVMLAVGAVCVRTKLLNEESLQGICRLDVYKRQVLAGHDDA